MPPSVWRRRQRLVVTAAVAGAALAVALASWSGWLEGWERWGPRAAGGGEDAGAGDGSRRRRRRRRESSGKGEGEEDGEVDDAGSSSDEGASSSDESEDDPPSPLSVAPASGSTGEDAARRRAADALAHLEHHFSSVQSIASSTTVPSLLPALTRAVAAGTGAEAALARLRGDGAPASAAGKLAAWEELRVATGARLAAALAALPALHALVHVQLALLGRALYLEGALGLPQGGGGAGGWPHAPGGPSGPAALHGQPASLPPPPPSAAAQEKFLALAETMARGGATPLTSAARRAAEKALGPLRLQDLVDGPASARLLSDLLAALADEAPANDPTWSACLLPPPASWQVLAPGLAAGVLAPGPAPPPGPPQAAAAADARALAGLADELAAVVRSAEFSDAVSAGARRAAAAAATDLRGRLPPQGVPLARALPALAAAAADATDASASAALAALRDSPELEALCAAVYGGGGAPAPA